MENQGVKQGNASKREWDWAALLESWELPVLFWNYHYFVLFSWNKLCLSKEAPSDTLGRLESEREHWICVWFYGIQHRLAGKSDFPRQECLLLAAIGISQPLVWSSTHGARDKPPRRLTRHWYPWIITLLTSPLTGSPLPAQQRFQLRIQGYLPTAHFPSDPNVFLPVCLPTSLPAVLQVNPKLPVKADRQSFP